MPTCYSAVRHSIEANAPTSFDLHVLGTPLAFTLSQDRTRVNRECHRVDRDRFLSVVKVPVPSRTVSGGKAVIADPIPDTRNSALGRGCCNVETPFRFLREGEKVADDTSYR